MGWAGGVTELGIHRGMFTRQTREMASQAGTVWMKAQRGDLRGLSRSCRCVVRAGAWAVAGGGRSEAGAGRGLSPGSPEPRQGSGAGGEGTAMSVCLSPTPHSGTTHHTPCGVREHGRYPSRHAQPAGFRGDSVVAAPEGQAGGFRPSERRRR